MFSTMQHHHEIQTSLLEADSEKDNAAPEPIEVCFSTYVHTYTTYQSCAGHIIYGVYIEQNLKVMFHM